LDEAEAKLLEVLEVFQGLDFQKSLEAIEAITQVALPSDLNSILQKVQYIDSLLKELKNNFRKRSLIKLGNSLAVTLPNEYTNILNLSAGEKVILFRKDNHFIITCPIHKNKEQKEEDEK